MYHAVTWADLQTFDQVMTPWFTVSLFDEAFPQGWTYRYEPGASGINAKDSVLQIFDEGASEPVLWAYLTDPASPDVPFEGAQVVFTGERARFPGEVAYDETRVVALACTLDKAPAIQDLVTEGLLYAATGSRNRREGAYAVRADDGVRIFTPYYTVSLGNAQLEPGWSFMLVENPTPEEGDTSMGFHRLQVVLGENDPAFGSNASILPRRKGMRHTVACPLGGRVSRRQAARGGARGRCAYRLGRAGVDVRVMGARGAGRQWGLRQPVPAHGPG